MDYIQKLTIVALFFKFCSSWETWALCQQIRRTLPWEMVRRKGKAKDESIACKNRYYCKLQEFDLKQILCIKRKGEATDNVCLWRSRALKIIRKASQPLQIEKKNCFTRITDLLLNNNEEDSDNFASLCQERPLFSGGICQREKQMHYDSLMCYTYWIS